MPGIPVITRSAPPGQVVPQIAMTEPKVLSTTLKTFDWSCPLLWSTWQENRNKFVKNATGNQVRQARERSVKSALLQIG